MDYAFCMFHPSVLGCLITKALGPPEATGQQAFQRLATCLFAQPGLYAKIVSRWDGEHPTTPFIPQAGDTITLTQMTPPPRSMANLTIEDVAHVLITNSIPVSWVDHAYVYGLHYLNQCYTGDDTKYLGLYNNIDNEQLVRITLHGIPPLLPDWDDWWAPSDSDITWIYMLMAIKKGEGHYCLDDSDYWLPLGGELYPLYIQQ